MASINYATREISCKIVYYGPGLSGKTTNLQIIHRKIPDKDKSEMVSLATETDRTLFFDFLPLDLGSIKGFSTKFQLYTVPGQVYYNATRKLVLRGVDGVVFVVDSQVDKLQENLESFANLQENLREYGHSIENIPMVLQYNKRDLPNVYPLDQLNSLVNKHRLPYYEAVAATGVGVFTTLKAIGKSVIDKFNAKYAGFQGGGRRPAAAAPAAPAPQAPQGNFGAPAPQAPQRDPLRTPPAPGGGFGGFAAGPAAPAAPNFPGSAPSFPPQQPGFRPPQPPQGNPMGGGFPAPAQNPFQGNPPFPPQGGGFPGGPAQTPQPPAGNPFAAPQGNPPQFKSPSGSGGLPKPGFPPAFQGGAPGGAGFGGPAPVNPPGGSQFPFPGPKQPGPGPLTTPGFAPPGGNIPVSPFVESFGTGAKQPFGNPPAQPPQGNPFGGPGAGGLQPPPGFGQNKPFPPGPQGPGAPGGFQGFPPPQQQGAPGFGGQPGFPAPKQPGPAFPPPGGNPQFPQAPMGAPPQGGQPPAGPGFEDNSGIVSTYEDMAKDDSFKTRKLPHPNDKKKGFFDGLFKKEK